MEFKGCGKRVFCEHNKDNLKCGTEWCGDIHYCERCFGKLDIIEKDVALAEFLSCRLEYSPELIGDLIKEFREKNDKKHN